MFTVRIADGKGKQPAPYPVKSDALRSAALLAKVHRGVPVRVYGPEGFVKKFVR